MNRMTWIVASLATVATLGLAGQVQAQTANTRVGVVNIGTVFTKYQKAADFKKEMENTLKPFKEKADKIKKDILAYQSGVDDPKVEPKLKEQYIQAIRSLKRNLEDLDLEARKAIGSKQETHLVQLYKEVSDHIQAVSNANGFHLILGFGEPPTTELYSFGNVNRKLTAMDMGSIIPLYYNAGLDISETVVASLNRSYTQSPTPMQPVIPVSNGGNR